MFMEVTDKGKSIRSGHKIKFPHLAKADAVERNMRFRDPDGNYIVFRSFPEHMIS